MVFELVDLVDEPLAALDKQLLRTAPGSNCVACIASLMITHDLRYA